MPHCFTAWNAEYSLEGTSVVCYSLPTLHWIMDCVSGCVILGMQNCAIHAIKLVPLQELHSNALRGFLFTTTVIFKLMRPPPLR